jgi:hypothetical protein
MNDAFLKELEDAMKLYKFWGNLYFILNDYFHWIGTVISIIIPFGFAALLYLPKENMNGTNITLLILSALGLCLTIARSLFKFPERAKYSRSQLSECRELKIKIIAEQIELGQAAKTLIGIRKNEINEPLP